MPEMTIEQFHDDVVELYKYRDSFFFHFPLDEAGLRPSRIKAKVDEISLKYSSLVPSSASERCQLSLLFGKLYHCLESFDSRALDHLSKAVKLNPKHGEAWCLLGECYWKKNEYDSAYNCFNSALEYEKDASVLRNISMVLRALPCDSHTDRQKNIEDSISRAKEALQFDVHSGKSWMVLGNAYLSSFFTKNQLSTTMKLALSAYNNAFKDTTAANEPDLHYNSAMAHLYMDDFEKALRGFDKASKLDPSWTDAREKKDQVLGFVRSIQSIVSTKGKLKPKLRKSIVDSFKSKKDKDLGPYAFGSYSNSSGETATLAYSLVNSLNAESNADKVILLKVVGIPRSNMEVCYSCCGIDENDTCVLVNIFNISSDRAFGVGDSMAIPDPCLELVDFSFEEEHFQFSVVRVPVPDLLVVNGKKVTPQSWRSPIVFSSKVTSN